MWGAAEVWGAPHPQRRLCRRSWGKKPPLGSRAALQPVLLEADSYDIVCSFSPVSISTLFPFSIYRSFLHLNANQYQKDTRKRVFLMGGEGAGEMVMPVIGEGRNLKIKQKGPIYTHRVSFQ